MFSLVVFLDRLQDADYVRYLASLFGVPFQFPRKNSGRRASDAPLPVPAPVADRLRALERLDLRLYARTLEGRLADFEAWRGAGGT